MNGCNGRMGQVITGLIEQDETVEIVAGIDQYDGIKNDYPVYASIEDCEVEADAVIDFSNAAADANRRSVFVSIHCGGVDQTGCDH